MGLEATGCRSVGADPTAQVADCGGVERATTIAAPVARRHSTGRVPLVQGVGNSRWDLTPSTRSQPLVSHRIRQSSGQVVDSNRPLGCPIGPGSGERGEHGERCGTRHEPCPIQSRLVAGGVALAWSKFDATFHEDARFPLRRVKSMPERFAFSDLRELFAKANEEKSGDQLAGIAARSERERVAAKRRLADLPLAEIVAQPLIDPATTTSPASSSTPTTAKPSRRSKA